MYRAGNLGSAQPAPMLIIPTWIICLEILFNPLPLECGGRLKMQWMLDHRSLLDMRPLLGICTFPLLALHFLAQKAKPRSHLCECALLSTQNRCLLGVQWTLSTHDNAKKLGSCIFGHFGSFWIGWIYLRTLRHLEHYSVINAKNQG